MSVKKEFVVPVVVLLFICFFVSGALAVVNSVTYPIITDAGLERAAEARAKILPQADGFEELFIDGLPRTIREVYRATNNVGYIFEVWVRGYGRDDIKMLCGVDMNGRIITATVLSHSETISFYNRVFSEQHAGQFWGKNRSGVEEIAAITGATISSKALQNALLDSLTAFEQVRSR